MILPSFGQVDAGITIDFPRFLQEVRSWRFRCWSPAAHLFVTGGGPLLSYCWWKKSCTPWDVKNPVNNGKNYPSTVAGFLPSTVFLVYLPTYWGKRLGRSFEVSLFVIVCHTFDAVRFDEQKSQKRDLIIRWSYEMKVWNSASSISKDIMNYPGSKLPLISVARDTHTYPNWLRLKGLYTYPFYSKDSPMAGFRWPLPFRTPRGSIWQVYLYLYIYHTYQQNVYLGVGNSNIFGIFTPDPWGFHDPIWPAHIFSGWVVATTNQIGKSTNPMGIRHGSDSWGGIGTMALLYGSSHCSLRYIFHGISVCLVFDGSQR